jgi:hypothetical protein
MIYAICLKHEQSDFQILGFLHLCFKILDKRDYIHKKKYWDVLPNHCCRRNAKVNLSHYKPGQTLRASEG